jgi:hypothetical protein
LPRRSDGPSSSVGVARGVREGASGHPGFERRRSRWAALTAVGPSATALRGASTPGTRIMVLRSFHVSPEILAARTSRSTRSSPTRAMHRAPRRRGCTAPNRHAAWHRRSPRSSLSATRLRAPCRAAVRTRTHGSFVRLTSRSRQAATGTLAFSAATTSTARLPPFGFAQRGRHFWGSLLRRQPAVPAQTTEHLEFHGGSGARLAPVDLSLKSPISAACGHGWLGPWP